MALGLAAVSPFFLVAAFASILVAVVLPFPEAPAQGSKGLPEEISRAFTQHFVLALAAIAVLLLGGILVAPFYWYLHIWREPESPAT